VVFAVSKKTVGHYQEEDSPSIELTQSTLLVHGVPSLLRRCHTRALLLCRFSSHHTPRFGSDKGTVLQVTFSVYARTRSKRNEGIKERRRCSWYPGEAEKERQKDEDTGRTRHPSRTWSSVTGFLCQFGGSIQCPCSPGLELKRVNRHYVEPLC
jgi:hypothetical protein